MGQPLNQILYGPPGTGKTYNTIYKALSILEPEIDYKEGKTREEAKTKFDEYVASERIVFTTFHQSMSYEDFVEGIKPSTVKGTITYKPESGVFKTIAEKASTITLKDFYDSIVRDIQNSDSQCIGLPQKSGGNVTITEKDESLYYTKESKPAKIACKRITEIIEHYGPDFSEVPPSDIHEKFGGDGSAIWAIGREILRRQEMGCIPFVLIIDEINRGNVANIFGELITLIEEDKRIGNPEETKVTLPYSKDSKEKFGVPNNLYIIGTMNTADRSVEALDSALRRRFTFEEMMPDPSKLGKNVDGVNLQNLLTTINRRIEVLKDREHQIGHSYFIGIKSKREIVDVIQKKVVPLLQEYFYGDYEKIMQVIGKGFVTKEKPNISFAGEGGTPDMPDAIYYIVKNIEDKDIDDALVNISFDFKKSEATQSDGE